MGERGDVVRGKRATFFGRAHAYAIRLGAAARGVSLWVVYDRDALIPADPPPRMCHLADRPALSEGDAAGMRRSFFDILERRGPSTRSQSAFPSPSVFMCETWQCASPPPPPGIPLDGPTRGTEGVGTVLPGLCKSRKFEHQHRNSIPARGA